MPTIRGRGSRTSRVFDVDVQRVPAQMVSLTVFEPARENVTGGGWQLEDVEGTPPEKTQ
jgi:hypothetical protein